MRSHLLGKYNFSTDKWLLALGVICFTGAGLIHQKTKKPNLTLDKQDTAVNVNQDLLVLMSAGNKRFLADILWVQTLLESDLDHYKSHDLKSWLYLRFKSISKLDPLFYQNYYWGGQYLTIVKDDLKGGVDLLEDGYKVYPDDYKITYLLGFSYYYELGDYEKGYYYLDRIKNHPNAPQYLPSVLLKMKIENGFSIDTAVGLVKNQLDQTVDANLKRKLSADYYAVKAERDLNCLNSEKRPCEVLDAEGNPYVKRNNRFEAVQPFKPYRLTRRGEP